MRHALLRALTWTAALTMTSLALGQEPFPLKTCELKVDNARYFVEGRQRIEGREKVVSLRAMTLEGRGEGAVLEVAGRLELKAVTGGSVRVRNLTIEVAPDCRDLYFSDVTFEGSGGLRAAEDAPADTTIYLSKVRFEGGALLDLAMTAGKLDLHGVYSEGEVRILGVDPTPKKSCKLQLLMLGNATGKSNEVAFRGGFTLRKAAKATVRTCNFAGGALTIEDCLQIDFDGNLVQCKSAAIRHSKFDGLKKTKVMNCDFVTKDVTFFTPRNEKKPDKRFRLTLDKCWFSGATDDAEILAERVIDGTRDPENGVALRFKRTTKVPVGFAGRPAR